MANFNVFKPFGITFPPEWIEYYNKSNINTNDLGISIPFGPYDWTCISIDNILEQLKGKTIPCDKFFIYRINYVLNKWIEKEDCNIKEESIQVLRDVLEYETNEKYIEGRYENETFIDVAIHGLPLGQYLVISMTKDGKHFFFRKDGGSNDYCRYHNMQIYKKWDPLQPGLDVYNITDIMSIINNTPIIEILDKSHSGHDIEVDYNELQRDHKNKQLVNEIQCALFI